jgi:hypothetical protein
VSAASVYANVFNTSLTSSGVCAAAGHAQVYQVEQVAAAGANSTVKQQEMAQHHEAGRRVTVGAACRSLPDKQPQTFQSSLLLAALRRMPAPCAHNRPTCSSASGHIEAPVNHVAYPLSFMFFVIAVSQGLAIGFVLLRVEGLVEEGKL